MDSITNEHRSDSALLAASPTLFTEVSRLGCHENLYLHYLDAGSVAMSASTGSPIFKFHRQQQMEDKESKKQSQTAYHAVGRVLSTMHQRQ